MSIVNTRSLCIDSCDHILSQMPDIWRNALTIQSGFKHIEHITQMLAIDSSDIAKHSSDISLVAVEVQAIYDQISKLQDRLLDLKDSVSGSLSDIHRICIKS